MVLRATTKFAERLKIQSLEKYDGKVSAFDEWYAHVFIAERIQYILLTNAYSLYSCVFPAKGVTNLRTFADVSYYWLTETMRKDGCGELVNRFIAQGDEVTAVYATNNRGVLGSMNDMVSQTKFFIYNLQLPQEEISSRLNGTVYKHIKYKRPVKILKQMALS